MLALINPVARAEPFDHPDWLFEAKFDGFRASADTDRGRLISRYGNRMQRFEEVLDPLPKDCVFDGELVVLDDAGRPLFDELLFGRRRPIYVAFDLLMADGVDLRLLPLKHRKAMLARIGKGAEGWIALTNGVVGEGCARYRAVVDADLEGVVAKRLADAYEPKRARWHKVLDRGYSQRQGRAEWFRERRGRYARATNLSDLTSETTDDPVDADTRNFYKVELWTRGDQIERMLFAGTSLDRARVVFADYARHRRRRG